MSTFMIAVIPTPLVFEGNLREIVSLLCSAHVC